MMMVYFTYNNFRIKKEFNNNFSGAGIHWDIVREEEIAR